MLPPTLCGLPSFTSPPMRPKKIRDDSAPLKFTVFEDEKNAASLFQISSTASTKATTASVPTSYQHAEHSFPAALYFFQGHDLEMRYTGTNHDIEKSHDSIKNLAFSPQLYGDISFDNAWSNTVQKYDWKVRIMEDKENHCLLNKARISKVQRAGASRQVLGEIFMDEDKENLYSGGMGYCFATNLKGNGWRVPLQELCSVSEHTEIGYHVLGCN